jgi:hypothetical protein
VLRYVNMTSASAIQQGQFPRLTGVCLDLDDRDQAAEQLAMTSPDLVFTWVSTQPWWVLFQLPSDQFEALYPAAFGPWLPLYLAPTLAAFEALRTGSCAATVVNASYPDAVNPVLAAAGDDVAAGIGNVANNVPSLRMAAACALDLPVDRVQVRLVAHLAASRLMSRSRVALDLFDLRVYADGERVGEPTPMRCSPT